VRLTRRRALAWGSFGILALLAGCSGTTDQTKIPTINGMTPGEYRDKADEDISQSRKRGKARPKAGA
jgi:hypothetical protein